MDGLYKLTKPKPAQKSITLISRLNSEFKEMEKDLPSTIKWIQNVNDMTKFEILVMPDEGNYQNGTFEFTLELPPNYPFAPPKVKCKQVIYHPNINLKGDVCLSILRDDWSPAGSITMTLLGLLHIFYEPNPIDPLNIEAAEEMTNNESRFKYNVTRSMRGDYINNVKYTNVVSGLRSY